MTPVNIFVQKNGVIVSRNRKFGPASIIDSSVYYYNWKTDAVMLAESVQLFLDSTVAQVDDQEEFINLQLMTKSLQCINAPAKAVKLGKLDPCVIVSHSSDGNFYNIVIFPKIASAIYAKYVKSGQPSPRKKFDYHFTTLESFGLNLFSWSKQAIEWICA